MMIKKETFVKTLNTLKESYEELDRFQDALAPFMHSDFVCKLGESAREALDHLLVEVCGCEEEDDIFFWWLFDKSKKEIVVDEGPREGATYNVETAEGLYDYLYDTYHHDD